MWKGVRCVTTVLMVVAGVVTAVAVVRRATRRHGREATIAGIAVGVWVLTVLTAVLVPGSGYLFVWPLLALIAVTLWRPSGRIGRWSRWDQAWKRPEKKWTIGA